jgi:hypothetical protein
VACPNDPIHPERLRIALEELHQLIAADRDESARTSPPAVNPSRSA